MSALYRISGTDGVLRFTLTPGKRDIESKTDLRFSGQGNIEWGEDVNQNMFSLLENFACEESILTPGFPKTSIEIVNGGPTDGINNPVKGQLWFNTTKKAMFVYTGITWISLGGVIVSAVAPDAPVPGNLWYDTTINQLKIWTGTEWLSVADRYVLKSGDTMTGDLIIDRGSSSTGYGLGIKAHTSMIKLENSWSIGQPIGLYNAPGLEFYNPDNDPVHGATSGFYPWTHVKSKDTTILSIEGAIIEEAGNASTVFLDILQNGNVRAPQSSIAEINSGDGSTIITKEYLTTELNVINSQVDGYVPKIGNTTITGNIIIDGTTALNGNTSGTGTLFKAGNISSGGTITGTNLLVGANGVWHAGNFNPNTKQDTLGYTPVNKAGDLISGSGMISFQNQFVVIGNSDIGLATLEVRGPGGGAAAFMSFHRPGQFAGYLGIDADNQLKIGGWSYGNNSYKLWNESNDGHGSGLDADTVDGYHASQFVTPSQLSQFVTQSQIDQFVTQSQIDQFVTQSQLSQFGNASYQSEYSNVTTQVGGIWREINILGFVTGANGNAYISSKVLFDLGLVISLVTGRALIYIYARIRLSNGSILDFVNIGKTSGNDSIADIRLIPLNWTGYLIPNTYYTISVDVFQDSNVNLTIEYRARSSILT